MIFECGRRERERRERRIQKARDYYSEVMVWHKRFAWLPVTVSQDKCAWLQTIEARAYFPYPLSPSVQERYLWSWEYRLPPMVIEPWQDPV